ncbi:type VI secretion system baseplate subunit TssG [soil metagenome]
MSPEELWKEVAAAPHAQDFYTLVRRIEQLHRKAPRLGMSLRPSEDAVRFGQDAEQDFAPAPIQSFRYLDKAQPNRDVPRIGVRFFGLFGPNGALPFHLTEHARDRERNHNDPTFARFVDLFQHRLISLFYRAWAQAQPSVDLDRHAQSRFGEFVDALAGLAPVHDSIKVNAKRAHVALLARNVKHAEGIVDILQTELQSPVELIRHVGHWMPIHLDDRSRLGEPGPGLGLGVVIGDAVWDRQFKFRLRIGPVREARYEALLPRGRDARLVRDWVRQCVGLDLEWDLQVVLDRRDVKGVSLGEPRGLGHHAWLAPPDDSLDHDDLIYSPDLIHASAQELS